MIGFCLWVEIRFSKGQLRLTLFFRINSNAFLLSSSLSCIIGPLNILCILLPTQPLDLNLHEYSVPNPSIKDVVRTGLGLFSTYTYIAYFKDWINRIPDEEDMVSYIRVFFFLKERKLEKWSRLVGSLKCIASLFSLLNFILSLPSPGFSFPLKMVKELGDSYKAYQKKVPYKLIPFVW